ncbi:pentatricopeptide repeat-containing protein At2g33680-like [Cryptomeria japonica]|uniref:pentatricopeptide repeat-containing protein At2g33680-like n=1 Tax=Cryptomeria japonica TaxID=3369 RepID=UPI0027DA5B13|nr:pentatricopeptide repeat-containing protein At2g33680-like [Cryptomeria japonica]
MYISSALVDMYAKCGSMDDAEKAFRRLPRHDAVSWTAMIGGYVQNGFGVEALELFCTMRKVDIDPDEFTFSSILTACASLSLEVGKQVHAHVKKIGQELDVTVGNALVTMYSKCGSIDNAQEIFERMVQRNLTSWNSMILACAQHGQCKGAIKLFEQIQTSQVKADGITFLGVLHACCHKGFVAEGRHYFHLMSRDRGIIPREEHYACMVDLLGRAGQLIEAEDFINSMPFKPGIMVWQTLLGACTSCGNMELGIRTAEHLLSLDPQDSATYVLLSNIYAAAGRWDDRARVRKLMKDRGVRKEVGCSWIEVNSKVHAFVLDSRLHPQMKGICE